LAGHVLNPFDLNRSRVYSAPGVTPRLPGALIFTEGDDHQQYLPKNPDGYCGIKGTGVSCPIGAGAGASSDSLQRMQRVGRWRRLPEIHRNGPP